MSPPRLAVAGPVFETARSAAAELTVVVAVLLSCPGSGSGVDAETVAMSESTVPGTTPDETFTTSSNWTPPRSTVPPVQLTVPAAPTAGVEQSKPAGADSDTNVVPAGRESSNVTSCAPLGPLLATSIVYFSGLPAGTGSGASWLETTRSALALTVVVAVASSLPEFGSVFVDESTDAVLVIVVPASCVVSTATFMVMIAASPLAIDGIVHSIVPPLPGSGALHEACCVPLMLESVVPSGMSSLSTTLPTVPGPLLVTVMV